ncbi:prominin-1-like isoform X2 [Rhopilema esculentum]|uniref:prominin-1-like isoform X2 n=1 Tax=Rhopilema esculentum TaxID=499914 RepID=UPI0031DFA341
MKWKLILIFIFFEISYTSAAKKCTQYLSTSNPTGVSVDLSDPNNPKVTFPPTTRDAKAVSAIKTKYDAKGLDAFFNLAESFMNTVQKKEIPDLRDSDGKISFDKEIKELKSRKGKLYEFELPIVICFAIGIIFALLMPLVGCCFCCCRLCGKCGGDMIQDDKQSQAHFKCCIFAVILFAITIFMVTGVLIMFVTNSNLKAEVAGTAKTYDDALDEAFGYLRSVRKEMKEITVNKTDCLYHGLIVPDISKTGVKKLVGLPLKAKLEPHILGALSSVKSASENVTAMKGALDVVSNTTGNLKSSASKLGNELKQVKDDLERIKTDCTGQGISKCNNIDTSGLKQEANFTNLPNVDSELSNIRNIMNQNFSGAVDEATKVFNDIPNTVVSKADSTLTDVRKLADDAKTKIVNSTDKIYSAIDKILDDRATYEKYKKDYVQNSIDLDKFRYYGFAGLSAIIALIVVLLALGLTCGICGYNRQRTPTNRRAISHHGGNLIMASVGFMFIFSFFLFLFTALTFFVGEHLHILCRELKDGEMVDKFAKSQLQYNGTQFVFEDILKKCRNKEPIYRAIDGKKVYDLEDKLNFTKIVNIDETLNKLNFNLSDQTVLNADTEKSLKDLKNSSVDKIDFQKFFDELKKSIVKADLTALAANLTSLADEIRIFPHPNATKIANDLASVAGNLTSIKNNTVDEIKKTTVELETNVKDLKMKASNLSTVAENILDKMKSADNYVKTTAGTDVTNLIKQYTKRVLSWPAQFVTHVLNELQTNIARCTPVANIYDGLLNTYFCQGIVGNFNGFWIAMGWCLFFFVFAIIFGVKLAKFLRIMKGKAEFDPYPGYEMQQHPVKIPLNELSDRIISRNHGAARDNERSKAASAPPLYPE